MVSARFRIRRHRCGRIQASDQQRVFAHRFQRLGDERKLEILSFPLRMPPPGRRAVGMPDAQEPGRPIQSTGLRWRLGGHHRVHEWQSQRDADAPQKGASRQVFLGYVIHMVS
jgi:hypothetical protein